MAGNRLWLIQREAEHGTRGLTDLDLRIHASSNPANECAINDIQHWLNPIGLHLQIHWILGTIAISRTTTDKQVSYDRELCRDILERLPEALARCIEITSIMCSTRFSTEHGTY